MRQSSQLDFQPAVRLAGAAHTRAASPVAARTLKTSPNNLIYWELDSGQKPYAQLIGDVDLAQCKYSWDALVNGQ